MNYRVFQEPVSEPPKSTSPAFPPARVRVLLVDDHPMVRRGMRALLESTTDLALCAEAETPGDAITALLEEKPDVVCLDPILSATGGVSLIRAMIAAAAGVRILIMSVRDEDAFAQVCLQAGALGYAMKTEPNEVLLTALRRVAQGKVYLSKRAAMHVLNHLPPTPGGRTGIPALSERELQVFRLIGLGWSTRKISIRLGIGIKTVESHRENLKNKLHVGNAPSLVREATRWVQQNT